ncbi:MAG: hypothetical protein KUG69_05700 [Marinosulfonomonas sp.]|nr:hypothetical protein [Marinosulfonomonas sp.]
MTDRIDLQESELDALFSAAADATPLPSSTLLERVSADAEAEIANVAVARPARGAGLFARFVSLIGGWPTAAGLATATVAGIWIGYAVPETVDGLAGSAWFTGSNLDMVEFTASFDSLLGEG